MILILSDYRLPSWVTTQ